MNKLTHGIGYTLLAVFLFSIHTQLLYWLQPDFLNGKMIDFSWQRLTEKTLQGAISGALFGLITVIIISTKQTNRFYKVFIIAVSVLDGLAVFYCNEIDLKPEIKMLFSSIHYSVYTVFIILVYGLIPLKKDHEIRVPELTDAEVKSLMKEIEPELIAIDERKNGNISEGEIITLLKSGMKGNEISVKYGISESKVSRIKKNNLHLILAEDDRQ